LHISCLAGKNFSWLDCQQLQQRDNDNDGDDDEDCIELSCLSLCWLDPAFGLVVSFSLMQLKLISGLLLLHVMQAKLSQLKISDVKNG